ncbi:MAG: hypothetical protein ACI9S8_002050 [Chlamydiales bacterium]
MQKEVQMPKITTTESSLKDKKRAPNPLNRKSVGPTLFRGETFSLNLSKILDSELSLRLVDNLRKRNLKISPSDTSSRVLNHWDSLGLIECEREGNRGWRKFNVTECIWLKIIRDLRKFGISLETIGKLKPFYFEEISKKCRISFVEYYFIAAILFKQPVYFIVLPEGQAEFLSFNEFIPAIEVPYITGCLNHISININNLLNETLERDIQAEPPLTRSISIKENEVVDAIKNEDFDQLVVYKTSADGLSQLKMIKYFNDASISDYDLTTNYDDVKLESNIKKGRVVAKKRTVSKYINNNA